MLLYYKRAGANATLTVLLNGVLLIAASKAFGTLLDTHVTTVVSCAFLFLFGSPAVKGFAITLVVGLVTNLFTSVFVSRVAFHWDLCRRGAARKLSILS